VTEATGMVQKLPTAHYNLDVAKISPDGKYVAFNASKNGDDQENVYVMANDGSGEALVFPSAAYQEPIGWTPEGKYMLFAQYGASVSLWAVPIANGKVQGPVVNMHTDFEKGTSLLGINRSGTVFYRTVSSGSDVYTATLDPVTGKVTSAPRPVPVPGGSVGAVVLPRWAPDSRRLAYMHLGTEREMYVFSFDTSKEQRIAPQAKLPGAEHCWSRDGSSLFLNHAENRGRPEAMRFDLASDQMTSMFGGTEKLNLANCSGDVVLVRTASGIAARGLGAGPEKEIYRPAPHSGTLAPVISHDGRTVAFVTPGVGAPVAGMSVLHVVSSDGGPVRDLASSNSPAEFQAYWGALSTSPAGPMASLPTSCCACRPQAGRPKAWA
jgi:Tol biopolymer transport system component